MKRYQDSYQRFLLEAVFELVTEIKQMTASGIGMVLDPVCGLSLVALADLELKRGQRLTSVLGETVAVRTDGFDPSTCNSFLAASSGALAGEEKFLMGTLSLAAHCCEPRLRLVLVKGSRSKYTLAAKCAHTIPKGSLITFRYCDPADLGFDCHCPSSHLHAASSSTGTKRKRKQAADDEAHVLCRPAKRSRLAL
jgi:hypothetical protein